MSTSSSTRTTETDAAPQDGAGGSTPLRAETHAWAQHTGRVMSRAVREAQEESRRLGVPNVYSIGGVIHYEQPDGSLSTRDPYEDGEEERAA